MSFFRIIFSVLAALALTVHGRVCSGLLRGPRTIFSDVLVPTGVCWLENVSVTGSIRVGRNAAIVTLGRVSISGSMMVNGAKEVHLQGNTTILGVFTASNTPRVIIGNKASIGMATVSNVNRLTVSGTMTALSIMGGGLVEIRGGKILGGGISRRGTPGGGQPGQNLVVCGATVLGGISMSMVQGNLRAVVNAACPASELAGAILVDKGAGNVEIYGNAMRAADVIVSEQVGDITIGDAVVSDMSMSRVTGNIKLTRVQADSDSNISNNQGSVTMTNCALGGDMIVGFNEAVTIRGNDLGNEVLSITGNRGLVTVAGNTGFSGSILENAGVVFRNNVALGAIITKNSVSTTIAGNTLGLTGLVCADNSPAPTGGNNSFNRLAPRTGQCANLRM